jgi:hypothetical protein
LVWREWPFFQAFADWASSIPFRSIPCYWFLHADENRLVLELREVLQMPTDCQGFGLWLLAEIPGTLMEDLSHD